MKPKLSEAQILLADHLKELGFEEIRFEYQFNVERKWKADIYAVSSKIWPDPWLFECDGGKWHGGHRRGTALEEDYERQNWAQMNGFKIIRFTNEQVLKGEAKKFIEQWL